MCVVPKGFNVVLGHATNTPYLLLMLQWWLASDLISWSDIIYIYRLCTFLWVRPGAQWKGTVAPPASGRQCMCDSACYVSSLLAATLRQPACKKVKRAVANCLSFNTPTPWQGTIYDQAAPQPAPSTHTRVSNCTCQHLSDCSSLLAKLRSMISPHFCPQHTPTSQ